MSDQRNWCLQCGALDVEKAKPECTKPMWHLPNWRHEVGQEPAPRPRARLPYVEDDAS